MNDTLERQQRLDAVEEWHVDRVESSRAEREPAPTSRDGTEEPAPRMTRPRITSVAVTPTILTPASEAPAGRRQWWYGWPATMQAAR